AIDEELRLRGVTEDLEPCGARGVGEGAEVDMGGDVLLAGVQERVAVRLVAVMAHQSASPALRVVVLVPRKAVVDDEDRAFGQPRRQAVDERHPVSEARALALARLGAGLEDQVFARRFSEQGLGERAAAGSYFKHRTADLP